MPGWRSRADRGVGKEIFFLQPKTLGFFVEGGCFLVRFFLLGENFVLFKVHLILCVQYRHTISFGWNVGCHGVFFKFIRVRSIYNSKGDFSMCAVASTISIAHMKR